MILIEGRRIAEKIRAELKNDVNRFVSESGIVPCLAVVFVGDNPASVVYVRNKHRASEEVGIRSLSIILPSKTTEHDLLEVINDLNSRKDVHGILVQLPLPSHINENIIINAIAPEKDVDGFHPVNIGKMMLQQDAFLPCTPAGIVELLDQYEITIEGKHVVIVGRSNIVGKPVAQLLLKRNATVTICHSRTTNLSTFTRMADILIVAVGKARFIKREEVKSGAVVIDVGINRTESGGLCGDVDFEDVSLIASAMTPVPGGVGPMTIAMLMRNTVEAARAQIAAKKS